MTPRMPRPCSVSGRGNQGTYHLFLMSLLHPKPPLRSISSRLQENLMHVDNEEMTPVDRVQKQDDRKVTMEENLETPT